MTGIEPTLQMWLTYGVIAGAIVAYVIDRFPLELVSLGVIAVLLVLFYLAPVEGPDGRNLLGPKELLAGFADPALITVLTLLVIGQGMVLTGALDQAASLLFRLGASWPYLILFLTLVAVMVTSAVLNNTPVVVIFIPILSALAERLGSPTSAVMIPLSFAAILGGNLTLIGSSTNLLVAGTLEAANGTKLGFFDFTVPGAVLASVGLFYVFFLAPRLLPDRAGMARNLVGSGGKQFVIQVDVAPGSRLDGQRSVAGMFPGLPDLTISMIQRGENAMLPPYDDITLKPGDVVVGAATRRALEEVLAGSPQLIEGALTEAREDGAPATDEGHMLAEAIIAPASRMDGRTLKQVGFHAQTGCVVLGIQRRSRMIRATMNDIRLEAGDVLLVIGERDDVLGLRANSDVLLLEWSAAEFQIADNSTRALVLFAGVVALAASGIVPIVIAALAGATAMVAAGCLNVRQAARAVDRRVVMMVGAALAMGVSLNMTGGAAYLAHGLTVLLEGAPVPVVLSGFFLLVALLTNILSNNATAVLFTPIAISVATELGTDPMIFVVAVIFAANCSFATPMGYQTNLLVMGPGHYRFSDFLRAGGPLIVLIWATYTIFAPIYYGL